jgi:hypothetical protein
MRDALNATGRRMFYSMCETYVKTFLFNVFHVKIRPSVVLPTHGLGELLLEIHGELAEISRIHG